MKYATLGLALLVSGCALADEPPELAVSAGNQAALSEEVHEGLAEPVAEQGRSPDPSTYAEVEDSPQESEAEQIVDYGTEIEVEESGYFESEIEEMSYEDAE